MGGRFAWHRTWRVKSSICCSTKGATSQIGWLWRRVKGALETHKTLLRWRSSWRIMFMSHSADSGHLWCDVLKKTGCFKIGFQTFQRVKTDSTGRIFIRARHENHGAKATTHVLAMKYDISIFLARTKEWNCFLATCECQHANFFPEMVVLHTGFWLLIVFPCKITGLAIPGFDKIGKLANNKKQNHSQTWMKVI